MSKERNTERFSTTQTNVYMAFARYCKPRAVVFKLFCFRTPRYNFSSTLYPQSCWYIMQVIHIVTNSQGSISRWKFITLKVQYTTLITIGNSCRTLTHVWQILELQQMRVMSSASSTRSLIQPQIITPKTQTTNCRANTNACYVSRV
jgi:hypothetical protein